MMMPHCCSSLVSGTAFSPFVFFVRIHIFDMEEERAHTCLCQIHLLIKILFTIAMHMNVTWSVVPRLKYSFKPTKAAIAFDCISQKLYWKTWIQNENIPKLKHMLFRYLATYPISMEISMITEMNVYILFIDQQSVQCLVFISMRSSNLLCMLHASGKSKCKFYFRERFHCSCSIQNSHIHLNL